MPKAHKLKIKASVGRQRVTARTGSTEARFARSVQASMALIRDNLYKIIDTIDGVTPDALVYGLEPIFYKSQELVPVDTGLLRDSGFLVAEHTPTGGSAAIGYAKDSWPPYAQYVHERLDLIHEGHTQAKFLEDAVFQHLDEIQPRVVQYIRDMTGIN